MVDEPAGSTDADYAAHDRAFGVVPTQRGNAAVLAVSGDVDALTAPELTQAIVAVLDAKPAVVIVDLSDVAFLASAGMSVLVEANELVGRTGKLLVVADGPATSRPIKLVGIDKLVSLHPTLDDALNACGEA
jgi:anti-sigma B factor antagonist